ncbi:MAG: GlcG/HbpS family heme-binding protein [Streptosporangiaceae bacterium]
MEAALHVIESARRSAEAIGVAMNIAVMDDGNNLVAFERMDGAWLGSIDIAQGKAYAARAFNMSTKDLAPLCQPGQSLFGIHASNNGRLIIFPGGIPLKEDGVVVGAIGVSGGAVEQDHVVAEAGAKVF